MYPGFGFVGSPNRSVPGATGTVERSAEAMTTPRRGPVRLAPLFVAALRMPGDIARGIGGLRARFGREGPQNFSTLLEASAYDNAGLSYRLPDHVHDERSSKW